MLTWKTEYATLNFLCHIITSTFTTPEAGKSQANLENIFLFMRTVSYNQGLTLAFFKKTSSDGATKLRKKKQKGKKKLKFWKSEL